MRYTARPDRYDYLENSQTQSSDVPKKYDWARRGLMDRVLPPIISQTKNKTTGGILRYLDKVFVFLLRYIQDLQHAKDPLWR